MAACLCGTSLPAQDTPEQTGATPTLHVYTNLVQIPVLVLDPWRNKLPSPIAQDRFSISFDGGPWHRPTYARLEADDPINLSIVLDARSAQDDLLEKIDQTIAGLAPSFLHPNDRVSIYAIDCSAMDYVEDVPAESRQLKLAVDTALSQWTARRQKIKAACNPETHLWDLLAVVNDRLSTRSGRRVLLAVSDGRDRKSKHDLTDLTGKAETAGITIFSLDPGWPRSSKFLTPEEGKLADACEQTGGMMLNLSDSSATKTMQRFTQMVRERYILEFPRPPNPHPGQVKIAVQIDKINAFIRASSTGVPLPNQAERAGSSAILPQQQIAPQVETASPEHVSVPSPVAEDRPEPVPDAAPSPASPVAGEQAPVAPPPSPSIAVPTLKLATRLTVEDVTVTDAQHRPVHGLERSDFVLKEDGKPQTIRNFEEYGAERPSPPSAVPDLPPNTYTNQQPAPANASAINILMLDSLTTGLRLKMAPENPMYARQQAIKYLKRMPPGTPVAILELGNGLRVVQGVTTDQAILLSAMNALSYRPGAGSSPFPPSTEGEACGRMNQQSQQVVVALDQAAAFLAGIKGRKNLIWFTPGIPWLTSYPEFSRIPCLKDYRPQLDRASGRLNEAQVALYPVDPRGLVASANPNAASLGNLVSDQASLQYLADATGGAAYYSRNDLDGAIAEAIATGTDFYSLSYTTPIVKYDGAHHTINVKVDRPNLQLSYRPGYTSVDLTKAPPSADRRSSKAEPPPPDPIDLAMGHGTAPSTQLLFDVCMAASTAPSKRGDPLVIGAHSPTLKGKSLVRYDLVFTLPADQLALEDASDGAHQASIKLFVQVYDAQGKVLNYVGETGKWTVKPGQTARFAQQSLHIPMQIDLPSGKLFVRFGLLDVSSQKIGTLEIPETVPK